jgi:hypothetical protein
LLTKRKKAKGKRGWTEEPSTRSSTGSWLHRYLPTSRLYFDSDRLMSTRGLLTSEEELERLFAEMLERLWAQYSAKIFGAVKTIQDEGLNEILTAVLSKSPKIPSGESDPEAAYSHALSFLGKRNAKRLLGSPAAFRIRYEREPHIKTVIAHITQIQGKVDSAIKPRTQLRDLIRDMFSGEKEVILTDNSIEVKAMNQKIIRLAWLSSGEKQLLRILLETLIAEKNTIIIDEPELSMHVDWQRRLIAAMRTLNPHAQIIMATHSPEIMAEVGDDKIFQL